MKVTITPTAGKVFVKLEHKKDTTASGIKIVNTRKHEWEENTVLAEIVGKHPDDQEIEVGQIAIIRGEAGRWIDPTLVEDDEFTYRIIDKEEIIALVSQPTALEEVTALDGLVDKSLNDNPFEATRNGN